MNSKINRKGLIGSSWGVGRYKGVQIRLHVTLLLAIPYLIFVTYAGFDALTRAAGVSPGDLLFGRLTWSLAMALLLFGSVLIHEFGHALVALKQGARVRSITLMLLGGISDIDDIPERPAQEFRLALIGPVVSLLLSGIGYGIFRISSSPNLDFISIWFGQINLVLAIFNLMPAFPLDGGRALRAVMASRIGPIRATQSAARISTVFAWIFAILGIISFNVLLVLIAFFLYVAAQSELSMTVARGLLKGLSVEDATTLSDSLSESDTIETAIGTMLKNRTTILPIQNGTSYSIVSLQTIRAVPRSLRSTVTVGNYMGDSLEPLDSRDSLEQALKKILSSPLEALPVLREGHLVGYIRYSDLTDVLQLRSLELPHEKEGPSQAA
ncbi:MAG: site-2 protease family protein [Bdellovibrionales bacterium]|nr:site-2 protease family protein [Bdellovibrionales bacterium]